MAAWYLVENEDNQIIGTIYFKYDTDGGGIGGQRFFCTKCKGGTEIEIIGDGATILTWHCHCPQCGDRFTAKGRLPPLTEDDEPPIIGQLSGRSVVARRGRRQILENWQAEVDVADTELSFENWFARESQQKENLE